MALLKYVWISGAAGGFGQIYFDTLLHERGTDFRISRNDWVQRREKVLDRNDKAIFKAITIYLMANDSGVSFFDVTSYEMRVTFSKAVATWQVLDRILKACKDSGFDVEGCVGGFEPLAKESWWLRLADTLGLRRADRGWM